jgi:hypothetical protein
MRKKNTQRGIEEEEEAALQLDGVGSSRNRKRARTNTTSDNHQQQQVKFPSLKGVLISILVSTCVRYCSLPHCLLTICITLRQANVQLA